MTDWYYIINYYSLNENFVDVISSLEVIKSTVRCSINLGYKTYKSFKDLILIYFIDENSI